MTREEFETQIVFPIGKENTTFAQYFHGRSYLNMLTANGVIVGNVTFEPGCRNNWHIHHAKNGGGQILLVTAGRGYYQEWGEQARELHPGDTVVIPAGVKHWHGAAPDSWFAHLAVEVPGEACSNKWCEPVSDEEYGKLKSAEANVARRAGPRRGRAPHGKKKCGLKRSRNQP
ncbi:MAG: cupin domain-containing protein [Hydrogeniiclostridium mannosilyticum]